MTKQGTLFDVVALQVEQPKPWQGEPHTYKQEKAIISMMNALGIKGGVPPTKGECCILIGELKGFIQNHLQFTGRINTNNVSFDEDEDEYHDDNWDMQEF
jgi:hypothetical protein